MRLALHFSLLTALVAFAPLSARAQSFFAMNAALRDGADTQAAISHAPIRIERWESARVARIRFEHPTVSIEGAIDVRRGAQIVVGVGEDVDLVAAGAPWRVTMLAGTWAPLAGHGPEGRPRVLLPEGLPRVSATIPREVRGADTAPSRAFVYAPFEWAQWSCTSRPMTVRAGARGGPRWRLPRGAIVRSDGDEVEAWVDGFVLHAFSDRPPPISSGCGRGGAVATARGCAAPAQREMRLVPAGTVVRAGPTTATLRADVVARVDPSGRVVIERLEADGASWSITGDVSVDLASLARVDAVPDEMRACSDFVADWPE